MPVFMMVSGFVSYKLIITWHSVKKRFVQLIIPWFVWSIILNPFIIRDVTIGRYINSFLHPGIWFLWALFFISLLFYFFDYIANKFHIKQELIILLGYIILSGIYVTTNFELFQYGLIAYHFLFYSIGFFIRKYWAIVEKRLRYCFFVGCPLFVILFIHIKEQAPLAIFNYTINSNIYVWIYRIATAIVSIPVFLFLFKKFGEKVSLFNYLGKNTMGIYILHGFMIRLLVKPVLNNYHINYYLLLVISIVVLIAMSCLMIFLIRKVNILKFILLGEKDK
jgi:fucose 4-O-acetylase-like acetyltransferase